MTRGVLFIIGGGLLLLHVSGFLEHGVTTLLIAVSLAMIAYGVYLSDIYKKIKSLR
jgi:hypothetical protein